jgi:hypothetical protein
MTRKKLNDGESDFLKGVSSQGGDATEPDATAQIFKNILEPDESEAREPTIRFTADLPVWMHRKLSLAAARAGKTKVQMVRRLLEELLKDVQ